MNIEKEFNFLRRVEGDREDLIFLDLIFDFK
jgi:hypothetical protein